MSVYLLILSGHCQFTSKSLVLECWESFDLLRKVGWRFFDVYILSESHSFFMMCPLQGDDVLSFSFLILGRRGAAFQIAVNGLLHLLSSKLPDTNKIGTKSNVLRCIL